MKVSILLETMRKLLLLTSILLLFSVYKSHAQHQEITNRFGIEFVFIDTGKMIVGKYQPTVSRGWGYDPKRKQDFPQLLPEADFVLAEQLAKEASMPGFTTQIKQSFYIGKFEVTQSQWEKVMGSNPSTFNQTLLNVVTRNFPVESVSWSDVKEFIKKLNQLDTVYQYRLPSEFEWEYAARAGAQDDIAWSDINKVAVIAKTTPADVGSKQPNTWGLYDMLGNVWEWVEDFYNEQLFADPVPPEKGKQHVLKGAPFYGDVKNATYMTHAGGPGSKYDVGFRLVMFKRDSK
jgi:formylglycine-generating enzyme required for sulfatase activity